MVENIRQAQNNFNPVMATGELAGAGYLGYKSITSGLRRSLGLRIEEHTTSAKNARAIIKGGKVLDPQFGASGASRILDQFGNNSKNYVHITGFHNNHIKKFVEQMKSCGVDAGDINKIINNKYVKLVKDTPLLHFARAFWRKVQRGMYRTTSIFNNLNLNDQFSGKSLSKENAPTRKTLLKGIRDVLFSRKAKTFFIPGTDNYFNTRFEPDINDIALKTTEKVKVYRTKLGAMLHGLKEFGLSGMKMNKSRVAAGVVLATSLGYGAYVLAKKGLKNLNLIKDNESQAAQSSY